MLDRLVVKKPLIFFDLETTGTSITRDRIIELCAIKIHPDKTRSIYLQRFNPQMPIEPEAIKVHGITNEMLAGEPLFADKVDEICAFFQGCDLAGYAITRFDVPLLAEELIRVKAKIDPLAGARTIDALSIFFKKEPRTLSDALQFYAGEVLENAHSAQADVEATIKVFDGQMSRYQDLGPDVNSVSAFSTDGKPIVDYAGLLSRDESGALIFTFGKNKGKKTADNLGMLQWMLDKDFPEQTKSVCRQILEGKLT